MLSIGKLGPAHYAYYEQSVADGREDYYAGVGEEQGHYIGSGGATLGFDGEVAEGDLKHLFGGTHPDRDGVWLERQQQSKLGRRVTLPSGDVIELAAPVQTAAFDLTFSAPKSASVLWALGDSAVAQDIKQAHEHAVRQAVDYLERTACMVRRGKAGHRQLRADGFVAAAFNHRSSRAGDPQLHTHVLVANAAHAEGRYTALHGTALYREAKTAGCLYQAVLRDELTRRLGVRWTGVVNGQAEIADIDRQLLHAFSKRSDEIANQLALTGRAGLHAGNAAAIDTRVAKEYNVDGFALRQRWQVEAAAHELADPLSAIGRRATDGRIADETHVAAYDVADEALAPTGLTRQRSTFSRRDLIQAVCQHATDGATVEQIEQIVDTIIDRETDRLIVLDGGDGPRPVGHARRADGSPITDGRADRAMTTRELLEHEHAILDAMRDRAAAGAASVPSKQARTAIDARPDHQTLAHDQRSMVEALTTSSAGVEVVVGLAGAGKTFSLEAAHDIWHEAGIDVRGCSTALSAAKNLETETGVPSETIARLRHWANREDPQLDAAIPTRGVLVVDEAGMVSTRDLSFLVEETGKRQTKLVLVGDHRQLPEIGAGGAFAGLVHRFEADGRVQRLVENRRQREAWERGALSELRAGSTTEAISHYVANDRIVVHSDRDQLQRELAADWLAARDQNPEVAMVAYTNRDVDALNRNVREALDQRGQLGAERVTINGKEWAAGDELLCLRNDRRLGLANGTRGTVTAVTSDELTITTRDGTAYAIPREYLERGHVNYGWATTGHKAQGLTINGPAFVLASDYISREWMYVAMSRAKDASHIYTDAPAKDLRTNAPLTPAERYAAGVVALTDLATRSSAHEMATDHEHAMSRLSAADLRRLSARDDLPAAERASIELERQQRLGQLRDELISNPPGYLLPSIGPVPLDATARDRWARNAVQLEEHRRRNGLRAAEMTIDRSARVLGRPERGHGISRER